MAQITWLKSLTAVAQVHMNPNINIFTTAELYEGYLEQLYTRRDTNAIQLSAVLGHKWLFWPSSSHRHTRCTSATGPTGISSKLKLSGMYHYVPVFSNLSKLRILGTRCQLGTKVFQGTMDDYIAFCTTGNLSGNLCLTLVLLHVIQHCT